MKCYTGPGAHEKAVKYMQALNMNVHESGATAVADEVVMDDMHGTDMKRNKDDGDVNYTNQSNGMQPCSDCAYFHGNQCALVNGDINAGGHCDMFEQALHTGGMSVMQMAITKASFDPSSGEMRWVAVTSDTDPDSYNERMSLELYRSFLKRIQTSEPAPEVLRSSFWQGGLPYLSVSHYLDL